MQHDALAAKPSCIVAFLWGDRIYSSALASPVMPPRTSHIVKFLAAAAKKTMQRLCAFLRLTDPADSCQLSDTLVPPILSYVCEVWALDLDVGHACEALHRRSLQLFGFRKPLAEFGQLPLQTHFCSNFSIIRIVLPICLPQALSVLLN